MKSLIELINQFVVTSDGKKLYVGDVIYFGLTMPYEIVDIDRLNMTLKMPDGLHTHTYEKDVANAGFSFKQ